MKKNMGTADRVIRTAAAVVIGILAVTGQISGSLAVILSVLAVVFLLTSALGFCPLYLQLKISTTKDDSK